MNSILNLILKIKGIISIEIKKRIFPGVQYQKQQRNLKRIVSTQISERIQKLIEFTLLAPRDS